jgi:hypothetical protein
MCLHIFISLLLLLSLSCQSPSYLMVSNSDSSALCSALNCALYVLDSQFCLHHLLHVFMLICSLPAFAVLFSVGEVHFPSQLTVARPSLALVMECKQAILCTLVCFGSACLPWTSVLSLPGEQHALNCWLLLLLKGEENKMG